MKYHTRASAKVGRSRSFQAVAAALLLTVLSACSQPTRSSTDDPGILPVDVMLVQEGGERAALQDQTVEGVIEVELAAEGDVHEVEYFLDGMSEPLDGEPVARADEAPFTALIDSTQLDDGEHVLLIRATREAPTTEGVSEVSVRFNVRNGAKKGKCAPAVNAGGDFEVSLGTEAVISASVSAPGCPAGSLEVRWEAVKGPAAPTFTTPYSVRTRVSFPEPGEYVLRLSATARGATASQTVKAKVTVAASQNHAPSVDAGADLAAVVSEWATLRGAVSDDGLPSGRLTILWAKVSGPGTVRFSASDKATTLAQFSAAGTYVLSLRASDDALSATDNVTVTVAAKSAPADPPTSPPTPPTEPSPPPEEPTNPGVRDTVELIGDPGFDMSSLPSSTRVWYERFLAALDNPSRDPNIASAAAKGDLYQLGRYVATDVTTVLTVFRVTGDLRLLDYVDGIMQVARAQLKDTNGDGYPNWRWLFDPADPTWYGDDRHVMDELMTHGMVAEVAWAFQQNRGLSSPKGVDYQERADFWADYLKKWEAKWRKRNNKPTGFPFIYKNLTHPYLNLIRYLWYSYRLTGDQGYLNEATRLANAFNQNELRSISTANGAGLVFPHGITKEEPTLDYLAPLHYAEYSTQVLMDLALEPFAPFTVQGTLVPLANTIATRVIDNGSADFAPSIGGSQAVGGLDMPSGEGRTPATRWAIYPLGEYAAFDSSGTIASVNGKVFSALERNAAKPTRIALPAAMIINDLMDR